MMEKQVTPFALDETESFFSQYLLNLSFWHCILHELRDESDESDYHRNQIRTRNQREQNTTKESWLLQEGHS